jgi:hypothetical protein
MSSPLTNLDTTSDRLLTEVERQQKYLARLSGELCVPAFQRLTGIGVAAA